MTEPRKHGGQRGDANGNWKGGRTVASNGYVLIRVGTGHPLADVRGYAYEHRIVAAEKAGRELVAGEEVHHLDGDKTNNHPDNIRVLTHAEHRLEHRFVRNDLRRPDENNDRVYCACGCGSMFDKYDTSGRPRLYLSGHNGHASPSLDGVLRVLSSEFRGRYEIASDAGLGIHATATVLSKLKRSGMAENRHGLWRRIG